VDRGSTTTVTNILFTDCTSFTIPNLSQNHFQSEYIDVDLFQI
jgi:hypothetical protein